MKSPKTIKFNEDDDAHQTMEQRIQEQDTTLVILESVSGQNLVELGSIKPASEKHSKDMEVMKLKLAEKSTEMVEVLKNLHTLTNREHVRTNGDGEDGMSQ